MWQKRVVLMEHVPLHLERLLNCGLLSPVSVRKSVGVDSYCCKDWLPGLPGE